MGNRAFTKPKHWKTKNELAPAYDELIEIFRKTGQSEFIKLGGGYVPLTEENNYDWAGIITPDRVTSLKEANEIANNIKLTEYDPEFWTYYDSEYTQAEKLKLFEDWFEDNVILASDTKFITREVLTKLINKLV